MQHNRTRLYTFGMQVLADKRERAVLLGNTQHVVSAQASRKVHLAAEPSVLFASDILMTILYALSTRLPCCDSTYLFGNPGTQHWYCSLHHG